MIYCVYLKDFELLSSIGIHDFEKEARQRILINVALMVETDIVTEDIDSVVDYDFLRLEIQKLVSNSHINLQENLCAEIIDICMAKPQILGVKVRSEKPDVYDDAAGVGCQMIHFRENVDVVQGHQLLNV